MISRFGGRKRCNDERSFRSRRMLRPLWAAALALMLLGLPINVITAQAAAITSSPAAHVYLSLGGAFNIFSLGMDELAAKLERMGIATTVTNYLAWQALADQAAAADKSGRVRMIILVGHSSGATAVTEMAARLSQFGVPVKLAIGLDPTSYEIATGNVDRYVNYYVAQRNGYDRRQRFAIQRHAGKRRYGEQPGYWPFQHRQESGLTGKGYWRHPCVFVLPGTCIARRPGRLPVCAKIRKSRTVIAREQADEF